MLLRDLKPGQRFEFVDKETPVVRLDLLNFRADQIFVFAGIDGNCPLLQIHSYLTGSGKKKYTVSPLTFSREVFILL